MANEDKLPPTLKARLLAEIAAEKAPTRSDVNNRRVLAVVACFTAFLPLVMGLRGDFHELPMVYALGTAVLVGGAAGALLAFGLSRGAVMMGPRTGVLAALGIVLPALVVAWLLMTVSSGTSSRLPSGSDALRAMLVCDGLALAVALPPLFATLAYRRAFSATSPALVGAVLGAAAGMLAHLGVHLHCPVTDTSHIMIGHFLPAVPLAVLGALLLSRKS